MEDTDATKRCLLDLIETLQARMPIIKEARASWEYLLPSTKNLTILKPVSFDSLFLRLGTVDSIEIATEDDILLPHQIAKALDELERNVHDVVQVARQSISQQETKMTANMLEEFKKKIIANDVYLEELEIDQMRVDFVNDVDMRSEKMILPEGEQYFTHPLRAKNLIVHDLEVESLCGITSECKFDKNFRQFLQRDYIFLCISIRANGVFADWTLKNDEGIASAIVNSSVEYINDVILLHSNLTISKLKIKSLNGTIIDELIDDLFIVNRTQKIKGSV